MKNSIKIAALRPRENRYQIALGNGLHIRVHPSGKKSWILRISRAGRVSDITLGHWPDMSLPQAKAEARRNQKINEIKPIAAYTLRDAFMLWCNLKRGRIVSYADERRRLERWCSYILICASSAGILTEIPMPAGYSALIQQ